MLSVRVEERATSLGFFSALRQRKALPGKTARIVVTMQSTPGIPDLRTAPPAEQGVGLLLPCNVCVWDEDGGAVVSIARPAAMFEIVKNSALQPVVKEAEERRRRAMDQISRER